MTILDQIIADKHKEVQRNQELYPVKLLEKTLFYESPCVSLKSYLNRPNQPGIIAEIKRASPSEGMIHVGLNVEKVSIGYMQAGAAALSVLTDNKYFKGKNEDLSIARKYNYCPILRKDFIIDEYQVLEAKSIGADAILLIAACLTPTQATELCKLAHQLGMEVLLEVHSEEQVNDFKQIGADVIGVNNRDLKTFTTTIDISKKLAEIIPPEMTKISESGIRSADDILELESFGYNGFLIGTQFMKQEEPHRACKELLNKYEKRKR